MGKVKNKKRVLVGLSGGVDSAVAAALLKQQGYDVAGVFMKFWKDGEVGENACCSVESEASALAVAQKLGIPFYVFNFAKEFKRVVVNYFLRELTAGHTPNPCVVCNPEIKFGLFLEKAKKLGADFVATGHYARTAVIARSARFAEAPARREATKQSRGRGSIAGSPRPCGARDDIVGLFAAKDKQKDQSYFLHRLNQGQLSRVIFPLDGYTKDEVYKLAKKWRLPHQARQSFDICFAGDYQGFLRKHLRVREGEIVKFSKNHPHFISPSRREGEKEGVGKFAFAKDGNEILGQHIGLPFYTIGQRASLGGPGPFFVVQKDVKKNILYVSNNERDLYRREIWVKDVNWLSGQPPTLPFKCKIKIRYGGEAASAVIARSHRRRGNPVDGGNITGSPRPCGARDDMFIVKFVESQRAITPGQSAVFYGRGGEVLGGGIIM